MGGNNRANYTIRIEIRKRMRFARSVIRLNIIAPQSVGKRKKNGVWQRGPRSLALFRSLSCLASHIRTSSAESSVVLLFAFDYLSCHSVCRTKKKKKTKRQSRLWSHESVRPSRDTATTNTYLNINICPLFVYRNVK